ncbi:MAG TPA: hypothetical protein VGL63_00690 [Streptosporangiaceae bacterium]|jgi:hypothetical protein
MRKHLNRLAVTALMAGALPLTLSAATASATTAHSAASHAAAASHHVRPYCVVDGDGDCLQTVRGTAEATAGLNIRSGPGTGYSLVGVMPYQSTGTVYCYSSGTVVNGDPYWDWTATSHGNGYVSDYWLYTGGNINQQVDPC